MRWTVLEPPQSGIVLTGCVSDLGGALFDWLPNVFVRDGVGGRIGDADGADDDDDKRPDGLVRSVQMLHS